MKMMRTENEKTIVTIGYNNMFNHNNNKIVPRQKFPIHRLNK